MLRVYSYVFYVYWRVTEFKILPSCYYYLLRKKVQRHTCITDVTKIIFICIIYNIKVNNVSTKNVYILIMIHVCQQNKLNRCCLREYVWYKECFFEKPELIQTMALKSYWTLIYFFLWSKFKWKQNKFKISRLNCELIA